MSSNRDKIYLLDTSVIIRSFYNGTVENKFANVLMQKDLLRISIVSLSEVLVKANIKEKTKLKKLLKILEPVNIDLIIAEKAAYLRKESLKTKKVFLLDCFIAATAMVNNFTLVTNNKQDFKFNNLKVKFL